MMNNNELPAVDFDVRGVRHRVEVPDLATRNAVGDMLPAYVVPPSPIPPARASLRVERDEKGWSITSPARVEPVTCATFDSFVDDCEHCLTEVFLEGCADTVQLHASGWATDAGAVLVLGPSGAGKSSLATEASLRGFATLGDDLVLIDDDGIAAPFKRLFKSDPHLLRRCGGDPASTVFWDPASAEAWFDPVVAGGWAEPTSVGVVVLVQFVAGEEFTVRDTSSADGLSLLVHSCFETGLRKARAFSRLAGVMDGASAFEVRFGDSEEAVRKLSGLAAP